MTFSLPCPSNSFFTFQSTSHSCVSNIHVNEEMMTFFPSCASNSSFRFQSTFSHSCASHTHTNKMMTFSPSSASNIYIQKRTTTFHLPFTLSGQHLRGCCFPINQREVEAAVVLFLVVIQRLPAAGTPAR